MRLGRFALRGRCGYGVFEGEWVTPVSWEPFEDVTDSPEKIPYHEVELLPPVVPTKIVAVGLNYTDHAREFGLDAPSEPLTFLKAPNTLLGHDGEIVYPTQSERVDYEAELAVVIGRPAHSVPAEDADRFILGYTCGLDITARDLQISDGQWTRAKNFDTFCPLGPWVETELDPTDLAIELRLNGETRQSSRTSSMIFDVPTLVSFISSIMTLVPGDVIMTGTPSGVGQVSIGDDIDVWIEGIGELHCTVVGFGGKPVED